MKITIINTGGTFNKKYNAIKGELEVQSNHNSLNKIIDICHNIDFEVLDIISKDSLDINNSDRKLIVETIKNCKNKNIIIIHGTDTIDLTAQYIQNNSLSKNIILTASMIPMSIDENEATVNFSLALGFLNSNFKEGVYLAMHGLVLLHNKLIKDRKLGKFIIKN